LHALTLPAERASMNDQLILDRYRLVERLAVGGSAEVWRAHDEQLDRPVAVKRLHPHLLPDAASRQRLVAEAQAAARLGHPAIVGVYDVDATGESAAIVMELVAGESLAARIEREGPLPEREAVAITADVADALFHAHQQGVVHRDVKPGNVLLGADGRTRLVDFGIAHSLAASTERLTTAGTVIGTLHAMAPEQLVGGPITPRTDLYGLGAVLLEALTGRPPYDATTPVALAEAQRAGLPTLTGLDSALAAAVAACLAHDPADRPLHAGALAVALRSWLAGDPSPAAALSAAPGVAAGAVDTAAVTQVAPAPVVASASPAASEASAVSSRRQRSRAWPLGAFVAIAAFVMAVAIVLGNTRPDVASDASPSQVASEAPSEAASAAPTQQPAPTENAPGWLAGLIESVAESCGSDVAQAEEPTIARMERKDARDYVRELVRQCSGGDD
jgi:tRNA A-37 threonylcarbamoyl transferase component Bud32